MVIITGAANGLGRALAFAFFQRGYHLALIDIDRDGLNKVKHELDAPGRLITVHQTDIANEEKVITTRLDILAIHHHVDIIVNNAGISISQPLEQLDITEFKKLFNTNFWGTVNCTKHFLPDLRKRKESRVVNIISNFAYVGFPGKSAYAASKSAILGFTNSLKIELHQTHVKVCLVIPPPLDTNLMHSGNHIDEEKRALEIQYVKKIAKPLDRTAHRIASKVTKGKFLIVVGTKMYWLNVLARFFPTLLHRAIGVNQSRFDFI